MTNTSEPLTGAALNRAIAERLGWRVAIEVVHNPVTGDQTATRVYEGDRLRWQVFHVLRDAIVWDTVIFAGDGYLPDWSGDVSAALTLCLDVAREHGWDLVMYPAVMAAGPCTVAKFYTHDVHPREMVPTLGYAFTSTAEALARLALAAL